MKTIEERLRIKFLLSETASAKDAYTFKQYSEGKITAEQGAMRLSASNKVEVTKEQFIANAIWLGWIK